MSLDPKTQKLFEEITAPGKDGGRSSLETMVIALVKMAADIKSGVKIANPVSTIRVNNLDQIKIPSDVSIKNWDKMPQVELPEYPKFPEFPKEFSISNQQDYISVANFPKAFQVSNLKDIKIPQVKIPAFPRTMRITNFAEIKFPKYPNFPDFPKSFKVSNLKDIEIPKVVFPKRMKVDIESGMSYPSIPQYSTISTDDKRLDIVTDDKAFKIRYENDANGNAIYIGRALPGSAESAASWQIKKLTYTDGFLTGIDWADAGSAYDKKWSLRNTYNY